MSYGDSTHQVREERALNLLLTEYSRDGQKYNHERLEGLQKHGETCWSKDGYTIVNDTIIEKAGDKVSDVGHFYNLDKKYC